MNQQNKYQTEQRAPEENHDQDFQDLAIERLKTIPPGASISIGDKGTYTADDLIEHIRNNDEIGRESVKIQIEYIRALKDLPTPQ